MRLLLVRHAETDNNRAGLVQGRADHPLNATGVAQARALAGRLASFPIAAIYSSPQTRAMQTAEPAAHASGLAIETDRRLIELDVGELEGLSGPEMRAQHPQFLAAWIAGEATALPLPGGESLAQVQARAWDFVQSVQAQHAEATVLCVTHNFVCLALLCRFLGLELSGFRRLRQSPASLSVLDLTEGGVQMVQINDTCHLASPSS